MMSETTIVAYWYKGEWYPAAEVQADRNKFVDANPYTVAALRNRREYGRDVPDWIELDAEQK
jgi:hypothetical protein